MVTSYEFLRAESEKFQVKGRWYYVILDEAQKIKNSESLVHKAVMGLSAEHRLILSGTPMQNSLQELWSLFNFVQPGLLGQLDFFEHQFCKTIIKGGYTRATAVEVETSKQCLGELREIIQGHILRRTKKQVKIECDLPERNEYIVFCNLTQAQLTLYEKYLLECREFLDSDYNRPEALGILNNLRKICNHPFMYFAYHLSDKATGFKMRKIDANPTYQLYRETRLVAEKEFEDKRLIEATAACRHWQLSGKLRVLVSFLYDWREKDPTTKVLVFSQTRKILDILERLCQEHVFSFLRMDGEVSLKERIELIRRFNQEP